jgi:hypothetical protein
MNHAPPSTARIPEMPNRPKSNRPAAPTSITARRGTPRPAARTMPPSAATPAPAAVDAEIAAAVEEQLAAQRAELTAKLVAEREEKRRREEEEAATRAAESAEFSPAELAKLQRMLQAAGVRMVPAGPQAPATMKRRAPAPAALPAAPAPIDEDIDDGGLEVPDADYSDTERVQVELIALLDLLGVVRVRDVIEHVKREDGAAMTPSNVRYHMKKLANRGAVKKAEERYKLPGLGYRTRDVWSRDPQKLLEILEGKKIVRQ